MQRVKSFFSKAIFFILLISPIVFSEPSLLSAADEIEIANIGLEQQTPYKYRFTSNVMNLTDQTREVILRAQISFYDRTAPVGDVPLATIHKDMTLILKGHEDRHLDFLMLDEGHMPNVAIRTEPSMRIRRQREWNY